MHSVPDINRSIRSLLVDVHQLDLKGAVSEFNLRMNNPPVLFTLDQNGNETSQESPKFVGARIQAYDYYEKCDIDCSHLAIESLISSSYHKT